MNVLLIILLILFWVFSFKKDFIKLFYIFFPKGMKIPYGWRELEENELIQKGDKHWTYQIEWRNVSDFCWNKLRYHKADNHPHIRFKGWDVIIKEMEEKYKK